jgi:hypothetical protein
MNLIMGISSVEASTSCVPFDCTNDCSRSSQKLLKMSFRISSRQRCHASRGPTGNVSAPGAKHGRKLPSTSDAIVESLSHHRGLPIFPHRVAASFSPANPRCAGHHANLRMKLRRRACLPGKWNPSSRRKCRAAAADRRHFRCVPAENSRIQREGPDYTRRAFVFHQSHTRLAMALALRRGQECPGGVARTSLCQKGVNRTTEGISDRAFLCSSVYSLALSERCNSTDMSRRSAQRRFGIAVANLSTTDWVYIQGYPVLKSRR